MYRTASAEKDFQKQVNEVFNFTDSDHDGVLNTAETIKALHSLGTVLENPEIQSLPKSVTISEFKSLVDSFKAKNQVWSLPAGHLDHLKSLRSAFDAIDVAKKGEVSREKLHAIFCPNGTSSGLTRSEFDSLFPAKYETVTFEQFVAAIAQSTLSKAT
jgi:Ca2+-binding EF-hand superfamily protein